MRPIDADWLKELYQPYESYNGKKLAVPIGAILANIDDAPTIDVATKWIPTVVRIYEELLLFEKETDTSDMKRKEDTMAVRYKKRVVATYPYKSKEGE